MKRVTPVLLALIVTFASWIAGDPPDRVRLLKDLLEGDSTTCKAAAEALAAQGTTIRTWLEERLPEQKDPERRRRLKDVLRAVDRAAVVDAWRFAQVDRWSLPGGEVRAVAWDPTSHRLAVLLPDGSVVLHDPAAKSEIRRYAWNVGSWARSVAFAQGGKQMWAAGSVVRAWDVESGKEIFAQKAIDMSPVDGGLECRVLVSADGTRAAVIGAKGLSILDTATLRVLPGGSAFPTGMEELLALSPDGRRLLAHFSAGDGITEIDVDQRSPIRAIAADPMNDVLLSWRQVGTPATYLSDGRIVVLQHPQSLLAGKREIALGEACVSLLPARENSGLLLRTLAGGLLLLDGAGTTQRSLSAQDLAGNQPAWGEPGEVLLLDEKSGDVRIWTAGGIRALGAYGLQPLTGAALSADGGTLALAAPESIVVQSIDRRQRVVLNLAGFPWRGGRPDEILLENGGRLERFSLAHGRDPVPFLDFGTRPDRMQPSPDGTAVLASWWDPLKCAVYREGCEPREIPGNPDQVCWSPDGAWIGVLFRDPPQRVILQDRDGRVAARINLEGRSVMGMVGCRRDAIVVGCEIQGWEPGYVFARISLAGLITHTIEWPSPTPIIAPWNGLDDQTALVPGLLRGPGYSFVRWSDLEMCGPSPLDRLTWTDCGFNQAPQQGGRVLDWVAGARRLVQLRALDVVVYELPTR